MLKDSSSLMYAIKCDKALVNIVFIDEVEGVNRRITDEAGFVILRLDPDTEAINNI